MTPARFSPLQRLFHWVMAACILAMLFIGVGMVSTISTRYLTLLSIHKPLGIAILVLALLRLVLRLRRGAPSLPDDLPEPMKLAAHLSHVALYALMIAMPLLGWAMLSAEGVPVLLSSSVRLPPIAPQGLELYALFRSAHGYLAYAFFAVILLHLGAALYHAMIRRDRVFGTMAPVPMRNRTADTPGRTIESAHNV
ncbi:cytochrome b [Roseomonas marmotae]|uniref:Cytochrome b n=1 Tax=Roseomonas marmotae TaxID=2768161 RepID=A0ABS3KIJ0_9PROT|nr:cytochrome b [Roseomonas marmotae]MBO1077290.1 cytochrome b [Roseomonas marmotae]QTI81213.1 cytochrome b [Roseomonas marmotae]